MAYVVIDKSWLQGNNINYIQSIAAKNKMLFSAALMYELLTTNKISVEKACFRKLRKIESSLILVDTVGSMINDEIYNEKPCGPLDKYLSHDKCILDFRLEKGRYPFSNEQISFVEYFRDEWENYAVKRLIELAQNVLYFFPELDGNMSSVEKNDMINCLIKTRCVDDAFINQILSKIHFYKELDGKNSILPRVVNKKWATFHWMQVLLQYSLEYYRKYDAINFYDDVPKELINDALDREYLVLGILAKGLATYDKSLKKYFQYCCTDGVVY